MTRSGIPARTAHKRPPESSRKALETKCKEMAIAELMARLSQRNRHAETTWGTPLAGRFGRVVRCAVSQARDAAVGFRVELRTASD